MCVAVLLALFAAACPSAKVDGFATPPADGTIVTCPVSGQRCEKTALTPAAVYEMKTYYFCCDDCPRQFRESPERFVR